MYRRKLLIYAAALAAGILCSYIWFERREPVRSVVALASFFILFWIVREPETTETGVEKYGLDDGGTAGKATVLKTVIASALAGAVLFGVWYYMLLPADAETMASVDSVIGTVTAVSQKDDLYRLTVRVDGAYTKDNQPVRNRRVTVRVLCNYDTAEPFYDGDLYSIVGSRVKIRGALQLPEQRRNPGCFDYRLYLKTKGIRYRMKAASIETLSMDCTVRYRVRRWLLIRRHAFELCFTDPVVRGFLSGVLFGDKTNLNDTVYTDFKENGTAHILAVSGLHVGFILAALRTLSRNRKTLWIQFLIAGLMLLYGEMTMWNVSTMRSVIIMLTGMAAFHLGRRFDLLTATAASAAVMLVLRPYMLFDPGFQLSYLAVLGIGILGRTLVPFFGQWMSFVLAVYLATAPYTAYSFNIFNPATVLINIPVVYIVSILVPLALSVFLILMTTGLQAALLIHAVTVFANLTIWLNNYLNFDGTVTVDTVSINPGLLIGLYCIAAFIASEYFRVEVIRGERKRLLRCIAALLIPLIALSIAFHDPFRDDEVVFIDVGQGDAVHLRCGKTDLLFDGGGSYYRNVGEDVLKPYFLKAGVRNVDAVVLSHLHMDHCKGAEELAAVYPVGRFVVSEIYAQYGSLPSPAEFVKCGDEIAVSDDVRCKVLWPVRGHDFGRGTERK